MRMGDTLYLSQAKFGSWVCPSGISRHEEAFGFYTNKFAIWLNLDTKFVLQKKSFVNVFLLPPIDITSGLEVYTANLSDLNCLGICL